MLTSTTEYGVDEVGSPLELERLEPQNVLVGGVYTLSFLRRIVVHNHGIQIKQYKFRFNYLQPPDEDGLKEPFKQEVSQIGELL